jgi:CBS domain containing-hemolysin-like protein
MATLALLSAAAQITPLGAALAVIGVVLCVNGALLSYAALAGRITRVLSRSQLLRIVISTAISSVFAAASFYFAIAGQVAAPATGEWPARFMLALAALGLAILLPGIGAVLGAAHGARSTRSEQLSQVALILAELLVWWLPKPHKSNGSTDESHDEPEFEITMASGEEVDAEEREYIENILELGETTAEEVMTPRTDVQALDIDWPPERILATVADSRFSRFPVFEDGIDNIIGILHLRDLLEYLARGDGVSGIELRAMIMEPNFIPGSRKVDDALRDLQRKKSHMAVVLDEYGGTAGILTIEDLLEEIVGEIQDEYDEETKHVHKREDGSWVVSAQLKLDDLNELLTISIDEEDVDTLGGFLSNVLGRIPKPRESVEYGGWRFTVLSVARNRIGRVLVERAAQE